MIVAGIASIELEDIRGLWLPFVLLAVAGGVVTWLHLRLVCRAVYPDYYYEGLISMFGMLTGTISSGVLLLREIDPGLETPAANNLITGSSFGIVLGAPVLILVGMAPNRPRGGLHGPARAADPKGARPEKNRPLTDPEQTLSKLV